MIKKAAGILFKTRNTEQVLFLKRGPGGDFPGYWCFPGGTTEPGETTEQTAERETIEEIGSLPKGDKAVLARTISQIPAGPLSGGAVEGTAGVALPSPVAPSPIEQVDFTTFVQIIPDKFEVVPDGEHTGYAWAPAGDPPQPLHPGAAIALSMLTANELDIARMIQSGDLASPYRYKNMYLVDMRITGTGVAYRRKLDEFVWRNPANYLNDDFLSRCNGLAVIFEHPKNNVLNSKEFAERVIGTILLPYIKGDEVWGVAKIYDDEAITLMVEDRMSTSPAIVLGDPKESTKLTTEDGSIILIEGKPSLLDHLAVCERGVWDKGGEAAGVVYTDTQENEMTKEEMDKAIADAVGEKTKADAENGQKLDKLLSHLDSFGKRLDAMEEGEAKRVAADKSKKDSEDEEAKKKADAEEEDKKKKEAEMADKAKKDADEEEKKKMEEKEKADSEDVRKRIADVESRLPVAMGDADYRALTDAQSKADDVMAAFGDSAPRPLNGESVLGYRRRIATMLKVHSPDWKGVDLNAIADEQALNIAETRIYADAMTAAMEPPDLKDGQIRGITSLDRTTGHRITRFVGRGCFTRQFTSRARAVTAIKVRRNDE